MADPQAALTHVAGDHLEESDHTPGMLRRKAVQTADLWSGTAVTEPGAASAWHHHGAHESILYLARGSLRMEFGPGGASSFDATAGDFVHVPPWAVHRETNPGDEASLLVVVRTGSGEPTTNVAGPA
jgi:uncharacterized RmlC-like cupin family protein